MFKSPLPPGSVPGQAHVGDLCALCWQTS